MDTAHDRWYTLRGWRVLARWPSPALAEAGHRILDYHGFVPSDAADQADWLLDFRAEARLSLPESADLVTTHESGLRLLRADDALFLHQREALVRTRPAEERIEGSLASLRPPADRLDPDLYFILTFSLLLLFQHRGFYAVHGAAVCTDAGDGVLLVADSDSGKSTMTTTLIRQGWRYLTDDSFFVHPREDEVEVMPFRRDFGLDPDAIALFPELAEAQETQLTDASKWRVKIDRLYPEQRAETCTPRLLLFPAIVPQPTSVVDPVTQAEALTLLMTQCSFLDPAPAHVKRHLDALKRLISQARCYRLRAGRDLLDDPERLPQILLELLA